MKNKEKQEFRSSALLSSLGLLAVAVAIVATPWNRQIEDSRIEAARQKAEVVGYQVAQIYREALNSEANLMEVSGRKPASVGAERAFSMENLRSTGTMGTDPWGEPYRYRILSVDQPGAVRVLIWSGGPNKRVETADLDNEESSVKEQPVYFGDDMGVLLRVSQK